MLSTHCAEFAARQAARHFENRFGAAEQVVGLFGFSAGLLFFGGRLLPLAERQTSRRPSASAGGSSAGAAGVVSVADSVGRAR